jgi:hypothetical protein
VRVVGNGGGSIQLCGEKCINIGIYLKIILE